LSLPPAQVDHAHARIAGGISKRGRGGAVDHVALRADAERQDACVGCDAVDALGVLGLARDDRRDMRAVPERISSELAPGDEVTAGQQPPGERGGGEVDAAVEHGDGDSLAARCRPGADGVDAVARPRAAGVVDHRPVAAQPPLGREERVQFGVRRRCRGGRGYRHCGRDDRERDHDSGDERPSMCRGRASRATPDHARVGGEPIGEQIVRELARGTEHFRTAHEVADRLALDLRFVPTELPAAEVVGLVNENQHSGRALPGRHRRVRDRQRAGAKRGMEHDVLVQHVGVAPTALRVRVVAPDRVARPFIHRGAADFRRAAREIRGDAFQRGRAIIRGRGRRSE
jgi:hypothetical protein